MTLSHASRVAPVSTRVVAGRFTRARGKTAPAPVAKAKDAATRRLSTLRCRVVAEPSSSRSDTPALNDAPTEFAIVEATPVDAFVDLTFKVRVAPHTPLSTTFFTSSRRSIELIQTHARVLPRVLPGI